MAEPENNESCVAGFVKGPVDNKDQSLTFWVAKRKFVLSSASEHAKTLMGAKRALICFIVVGNKNPKITLILREPSIRLIRQYMRS
jgi:hypothetical protein